MSYSIIRNEKKKMSDLGGMYKHNHRLYKNSSNKDIDFSKTKDNYFIKKSPISFTQKVHKLIEKYLEEAVCFVPKSLFGEQLF